MLGRVHLIDVGSQNHDFKDTVRAGCDDFCIADLSSPWPTPKGVGRPQTLGPSRVIKASYRGQTETGIW
jgi:hypothetical protein